MSFAVIQTGGKQYKVKAGEILKIEKLKNSDPKKKIEFKEILAYGDDKNNSALKEKILSIKENLKKGLPSIQSTLQDELNCNIFLRSKDIETFSKLRDLKDNFWVIELD